jgi:hypothetical protein
MHGQGRTRGALMSGASHAVLCCANIGADACQPARTGKLSFYHYIAFQGSLLSIENSQILLFRTLPPSWALCTTECARANQNRMGKSQQIALFS